MANVQRHGRTEFNAMMARVKWLQPAGTALAAAGPADELDAAGVTSGAAKHAVASVRHPASAVRQNRIFIYSPSKVTSNE